MTKKPRSNTPKTDKEAKKLNIWHKGEPLVYATTAGLFEASLGDFRAQVRKLESKSRKAPKVPAEPTKVTEQPTGNYGTLLDWMLKRRAHLRTAYGKATAKANHHRAFKGVHGLAKHAFIVGAQAEAFQQMIHYLQGHNPLPCPNTIPEELPST